VDVFSGTRRYSAVPDKVVLNTTVASPKSTALARLILRNRSLPVSVGSYGTRNILVSGMIVLERPTECLVLILICLSSILQGIPLSGGFA
jgi:hypothetical protein